MGKNTWIALFAVVSTLGACAQNDIRPTVRISPPIAPESTAMAEATVTMPPSGYLDYCMRNPAECPSSARDATHPEPMTPLRWAELDRVNTMVNASVRYVTDASLYSRQEYWTYPNGRGDCEDYVLAKRKMLLDRGWRAETLLIGVALDLEGLRHAVLIAATDKGDFVLDNQLEQVVAWQETGYTWEKRQTAANPNIWVALTGDAAAPEPFEAPATQPILVANAHGAESKPEVGTAAPAHTIRQDAEHAESTPALFASTTDAILTIPTPKPRPLLTARPVSADTFSLSYTTETPVIDTAERGGAINGAS
ncbi:transglutaminase-like cysteine peptidase [Parvibaculaceae bacterium PLY_AMNH_Bact1]|nr:transglutaminase-like cysteine peptidase [Parvibaculaceae bacterium PLY_AMNH_Bact1]